MIHPDSQLGVAVGAIESVSIYFEEIQNVMAASGDEPLIAQININVRDEGSAVLC